MTDENYKKINIIPFHGDPKKWFMWQTRQRAKVRLMGLIDVLDGNKKIPPDKKAGGYTDAELELRRANDELYADLVLSVNDPTCFNIIVSARTDKLKEGDDALAWEKLNAKYNSTNKSSKVSLIREFRNCRLDKDTTPDTWITKMQNLRWNLNNTHNDKMSEDDFITQLICNLCKEYASLALSLEEQLDRTVDKLTLEKMREQLNSFHKHVIEKNKNEKKDKNNEDKVLLADKKKIEELEKKISDLTSNSTSTRKKRKNMVMTKSVIGVIDMDTVHPCATTKRTMVDPCLSVTSATFHGIQQTNVTRKNVRRNGNFNRLIV